MRKTKKLSGLIAMYAVVIISLSCKKSENITKEETKVESPNTASKEWSRVFADDFSVNLNNWEKANRADYNSSRCIYDPNIPIIGNYDSKDVLVLTATADGSNYKSGLVKSNFSFKPTKNEEYRTSASIKLVALDGTTFKDFTQTYGAWPAFWTAQENKWPLQGEIDVVEAYSFGNYAKYASNLFYGSSAIKNQLGNTAEKKYEVSSGWHVYDEYWKNENGNVTVTIQLDGVTVSTYSNELNTNLKLQNFGAHNIIFNLNVGSNNSIGIFNNKLINLFSKTMMWVDYVTVDKRVL
ncbi:hypothetical protein ABIB40_004009 [Pedobacter sp. UYP30]|uniref:glycoside hydrolase family 16 protein n=1 Tax=Pedobacter sp. UYP30 TaxID=1756400 RepID=UPI003393BE3A